MSVSTFIKVQIPLTVETAYAMEMFNLAGDHIVDEMAFIAATRVQANPVAWTPVQCQTPIGSNLTTVLTLMDDYISGNTELQDKNEEAGLDRTYNPFKDSKVIAKSLLEAFISEYETYLTTTLTLWYGIPVVPPPGYLNPNKPFPPYLLALGITTMTSTVTAAIPATDPLAVMTPDVTLFINGLGNFLFGEGLV
jgi:hypothetical protein